MLLELHMMVLLTSMHGAWLHSMHQGNTLSQLHVNRQVVESTKS
jgi:hypothetical protein